MIGLDTNIIIRYLTQDDPEQSKKAVHEIEKGLNAGEEFFIKETLQTISSDVLVITPAAVKSLPLITD